MREKRTYIYGEFWLNSEIGPIDKMVLIHTKLFQKAKAGDVVELHDTLIDWFDGIASHRDILASILILSELKYLNYTKPQVEAYSRWVRTNKV